MTKPYVAPFIRPSGRAFSDLQSGMIAPSMEALLTANATATAAPTSAPTATATGGGSTGGTLAAGAYYLVFTEVNGVGETTASPESAHLTISAGNIPQVTFPALKTGNVARNLYLTAAAGASGTEVLYAQAIATTTYSLATAAPASTVIPPTSNTTALTQGQQQAARRAVGGKNRDVLGRLRDSLGQWLGGSPLPTSDINQIVTDEAVVVALLNQMFSEIATLVFANAGTLAVGRDGYLGTANLTRSWP